MSDTEISQDQSTYPVVILRAGLSAMTIEYSTLAEDLASHGYVVAGFDAPYRTRFFVRSNGTVIRRAPENDPEAPGNKEVQGDLITKLLYAWSADTGFIVDQLERLNTSDPNSKFFGRLDMNKIGVLGHSLGGATSLQFCHDDARCKAGIDIDGAPYGSVTKDGVKQPFMFLLSDHGDASDAESVQIDSNIRSIYDRLPPHGRLRITVRGSNHFNFADGAVTKNQILMAIFHKLGLIEMDGQRQLNITSYCVLSFFERYLRVGGDAGLEIRSPAFSEIEFDE